MNRRLRIAFAGTPEFAVPHLAACRMQGVDVVAVFTQPDRPAGRGRQLSASPVKAASLAAGYSVEQPETLKTPEVRETLRGLDLDLLIVVAYGLILPRKILALPRLGCWNVHASLLPRWRGAAPIQRAIVAGDRETGICLMQMEAGLDTGPVLLRETLAIEPSDTGGSLHDRLAALGARVLADALERTLSGEALAPQAQSEVGITYAHKIEKGEARLDWNEAAIDLERKVRAFDPWPVAEGDIGAQRVRVWNAIAVPCERAAVPGSVVRADRQGIDIACARGALRLLEVQRAGGRRLSASDFLNAHPDLGNKP